MTEKQKHIITTALRLFYEKGVHAVGINEILSESGVAKRTLYNYFETKDDLIVATLEYRNEVFMNWLEKRLESLQQGREALVGIFLALDDWFNDRCGELSAFRGCFFINVAAEYGDPASKIFRTAKSHKLRVRCLLEEQVKILGRSREEELMLVETLALMKEGAIVTAMVQEDREAARKLIPVVGRLLG